MGLFRKKKKLPNGCGKTGFDAAASDVKQPHSYPPWLDSFLIRPKNRVILPHITFKAKDGTFEKQIRVKTKSLDGCVKPEIGKLARSYPSFSLYATLEINADMETKDVLLAKVSKGVLIRVNSFNTALENLGIRTRSPARPPAPAVDQ